MKVTINTIIQAGKDWEAYNKYFAEHEDDKFNIMKSKLLTFKEMYGYQIIIFKEGDAVKFEGERYSDTGLLYKKGDKVNLPYGETGTVINGKAYAWMKIYKVKIRKAVFNNTNERVEFLEHQLNHE